MISAPDIAEFIRLIRKDNTGLTGWTRRRSSMRFTLDAIETYNVHSTPGRFNAIVYAREHIPQAKQTQYADALEHLDEVLRDEGYEVQNQELLRKLADKKFRVTSALGDCRNTFGEPFRTNLTQLGRHVLSKTGGNVIMPTLELTSILRQSNENNPTRKYRCSLKLTHGPTLQ